MFSLGVEEVMSATETEDSEITGIEWQILGGTNKQQFLN